MKVSEKLQETAKTDDRSKTFFNYHELWKMKVAKTTISCIIKGVLKVKSCIIQGNFSLFL